MRRFYIVSGILLILSTIDFAIAAPVLEQEKRQTGVDVMHILEDVVTTLGKRGDKLEELFRSYEAYITRLEESSAPRPENEVKQLPPSVPEIPPTNPKPSTGSGSEPPSKKPRPGRRSMGAGSRLDNLQAVSGPFKGNTKELHRISG
jgi:hypothetical protein